MNGVEELIDDIENSIVNFDSNLLRVAQSIGNDAVQMLEDRVLEERLNANLNAFGEYSESYQLLRRENNLRGVDINFQFTGRLWSTTEADVIDRDGNVIIQISPANDRLDILDDLENRFGAIFEFNDQEIDILIEDYGDDFVNLIQI